MDLGSHTVIKDRDASFVGDRDAQVHAGEHGFYLRDTRMLSRYAWRWLPGDGPDPQPLVVTALHPDVVRTCHAQVEERAQLVALRRTLRVHAHGLVDEMEAENTSRARRFLSLELDAAADFADLLEVRAGHPAARTVVTEVTGTSLTLRHTASDGLASAVHLRFDALAAARPDGADWELSLAPGERVLLRVEVDVAHLP